MIIERTIRVLPHIACSTSHIASLLSRELSVSQHDIRHVRILKRSIDARQRTVYVSLTLRVYINEEPSEDTYIPVSYPDVSSSPQVVVVGAGPGGLFAALRLIELGLRPVVIERGSDTSKRKRDIAAISTKGVVGSDSNYCFGEGGAGTFSDGKLYTRSNKRGDISSILKIFAHYGADKKILTDAHPHIGSGTTCKFIGSVVLSG